jgi:NDP-sugar pyrophosphorylase family protein
MDMQIIIPMSGFGERFRRAGYTRPKPLIEIEGKPIIAHVIDMFPDETDFIFICNREHLENPDYGMAEILQQYCPMGRIVGIPPHKLGPVHAVLKVEGLIDPDRPVVVNYCDFSCYWDWAHFKQFVAETNCCGAIPAYKGFHPHTLGTTNYAYMREAGGWVLDIQEKQPYTTNRMEEYASSGSYYFASGSIMKEAFAAAVDSGLQVNGEYYVSLAYKPLIAAHLPVAVYDLQHFMQWGTPEDVAEYNNWSAVFHKLIDDTPNTTEFPGGLIIPMAGLGQRFAREGYVVTKPLIPVSGQPMAIAAANDLPRMQHNVFVLREDMPGFESITEELRAAYPNVVIETVASVTGGQACTALLGVEALERELGTFPEPITFGACDNGALYDREAFRLLTENPEVDVIVWGARGHTNALRKPEMFGWIDANNGVIRRVSVKTPLGDPSHDPIVTGTFTFRRAEDFRRCVLRMIVRGGQVNGEFYLDTCINDAIDLGLSCRLFEISNYLSWGTPNELKTFEYWQSCFHKWAGHPYRLEKDCRVPANELDALSARYQATVPPLPSCEVPNLIPIPQADISSDLPELLEVPYPTFPELLPRTTR